MSEHLGFDVLVVGSGAAGMTAALTATAHGLRTLVVEKADRFGGSTARSGGGLWIPGNSVLARIGDGDPLGPAAEYLAHIVGPEADPRLQAAFLRHGPDMLTLVQRLAPLQFRWVRGYSDYYPQVRGGRADGRSIEAVPLPARLLGAERDRLNPPYLGSRGGLVITQSDYRWLALGGRHPRSLITAARVAAVSGLARARRRELLTLGQALAGGLRAGLSRLNVPVWLSSPLLDLEMDDDRVTGLRIGRDSETSDQRPDGGHAESVVLRARRGVILAAGGFEHNALLRKEFQPQPGGTNWTVGASENTGDAIVAGRRLGAGVQLMDDAWWGPSVPLPRGPYFLLAERSLPGCLLVNAAGRRFVNEAAPYVDVVHAMYRAHSPETAHVPAWLVFDQRYRTRYPFAARAPRRPLPASWYAAGVCVRAESLTALAEAIEVPATALTATVQRFNEAARHGRDEDFGRGASAYERYYGDPFNRPNPCLGPLSRPPFHAVRIVPGDLGTKGGLSTDERARVLRPDGTAIAGLYAAGNTSALVMGRTYAGPGATLGPAMTFGYIAALDLATDHPRPD